jgi:hypothetical protein
MKTKDQLQKTVDGLQEALSKAQSELSALDKPVLRHGDYNIEADFNIFAALAAQAEPLDYLNISAMHGRAICANVTDYGIDIYTQDENKDCLLAELELDIAITFHREFGRLIATAKRKAAAQ